MKLFQTKGYKVLSGFIYGWGASCVIIGALFKIMHFPGAGIILTVGMLVEAFIFFFSAFEPQMEHYDWTRVFPQLGKNKMKGEAEILPEYQGPGNFLDGLEQKDVDDLKRGIRKIAETADNLACIAVDVPKVAQKIDRVAGSMEQLDYQARMVSGALENSAKEFACGYAEINRLLTSSTRELAEKIKGNSDKMVEGMVQTGREFSALGNVVKMQASQIRNGIESYVGETMEMTKHISALNTIYEIQARETKENLAGLQRIQTESNEILQYMMESKGSTLRFKQESQALADNVASLNGVYGNMLSLVNNN